jgi:hypothetical protein
VSVEGQRATWRTEEIVNDTSNNVGLPDRLRIRGVMDLGLEEFRQLGKGSTLRFTPPVAPAVSSE